MQTPASAVRHRVFTSLIAAFVLGAVDCAITAGAAAATMKLRHTEMSVVNWAELGGWVEDDHAAAFQAFLSSCRAVVAGKLSARDRRPMFRALRPICERALKAGPLDSAKARAFFETEFRPVRIVKKGEEMGFVTGYYEPVLEGSRFPNPEFTVPIYHRPHDLAFIGRSTKTGGMPNKGPVRHRIGKKLLGPYHDRAAIEDGALDGKHLEICWVKDPIEAFFLHIQGSGRIRLEDGALLRVNYDAHNGHPYTAVGRILIDKGDVPKEEMSMDRIRDWMEASPDGGRELRRMNQSYIFFRVTGLGDESEPSGAQGVKLTPGRSLAVDKAIHVYGTPMYIEADLPLDGVGATNAFRRLLVAQDTGSAIIGPARADIYFGSGAELGSIAGRLRHDARFTMLVPAALDPFAKARGIPLPRPRPTTKDDGKADKAVDAETGSDDAPLPKVRPQPADLRPATQARAASPAKDGSLR